jgi:hypothetical protein
MKGQEMADSKKIDDGGSAFPVPEENRLSDGTYCNEGMSLRDWFAGQALSSIPLRSWDHVGSTDQERIEAWAKCAYLTADAMLAARKAGV